MSNRDSLGDRMKRYERASQVTFPRRMPIIIRVDGRAFHTLLRNAHKPFDPRVTLAMDAVAVELCTDIQGAQLAYIQSDECSVLVHGYRNLNSEPWFDNDLQKIVSISASVATRAFNNNFDSLATFDARAFVLPEDEVCNYFIWRQQDATRNSVQMVARAHFSHRQCTDKNNSQLQEILHENGINWNDTPTKYKRGRCALRHDRPWTIDNEIPVFTQDRQYIERHVFIHREEEK